MGFRNGILILTTASFVAVFSIFQLWPAWRLFKHGTMTEGIITSITPSNFGSGYFYFNDLSIGFKTENGESFSFTESWDLNSGGSSGQNVEIVYDAPNPTTAVSFDFIGTRILILLAEFLIIMYSIFLIIKGRKRSGVVS